MHDVRFNLLSVSAILLVQFTALSFLLSKDILYEPILTVTTQIVFVYIWPGWFILIAELFDCLCPFNLIEGTTKKIIWRLKFWSFML